MANLKPQANITINKGRTKVHKDGKVYLKEGTEFEIELYNPTTTPVLAKISMNGKEMSQGGLIVNPGQRYFLERFLDVAKKFKFETYEVSGSNSEVATAIAQNGLIEITFYPERKAAPKYLCYPETWTMDVANLPIGSNITYTNTGLVNLENNLRTLVSKDMSSGTPYLGDGTSTTSTAYHVNNTTIQPTSMGVFTTSSTGNVGIGTTNPSAKLNVTGTNNHSLSDLVHRTPAPTLSKKIETGRIEKGSSSNQSFKEVNMDFEWMMSARYTYQLLPTSQEAVQVKQIANYCGECGAKAKATHKFCSSCGEKL